MKIPVLLFWGNRSANGFCCLEDFKELDTMYYCATDDGSFGTKGNVIDLMQRHISEFEDENLVIYSCGPNPMLNRLKSFAGDHDIECQFSLETMMACGFGVCLGCNVKSAHDPGIYKYVCNNGPVFNANEIDLSE